MRLEKSYREKTAKNTNTWRLNNILLNEQEIIEEIKEKKNQKNYHENTMTQYAWDTAKTLLRRKFIAI